MGYPFKVTIFQASCRKVKGYPTKIVINLIENHFKVTIFPASCRKYLRSGVPPFRNHVSIAYIMYLYSLKTLLFHEIKYK